jgi:hypothetical protein
MYRRLFHHFPHIRSRSAIELRHNNSEILLTGGAVGAVLVVFIVLIYFWWVCYWLQESPAPVTYIIGETMVTVADASLPTGGGGKIH